MYCFYSVESFLICIEVSRIWVRFVTSIQLEFLYLVKRNRSLFT